MSRCCDKCRAVIATGETWMMSMLPREDLCPSCNAEKATQLISDAVAVERKRCVSAVSPQEMMRLMVSYGLIQEAAITDPEGYDEWKTTSAIIEMAEYIIARINAPQGGEVEK